MQHNGQIQKGALLLATMALFQGGCLPQAATSLPLDPLDPIQLPSPTPSASCV